MRLPNCDSKKYMLSHFTTIGSIQLKFFRVTKTQYYRIYSYSCYIKACIFLDSLGGQVQLQTILDKTKSSNLNLSLENIFF
jgi:hypothetical protein